MGGVTEIADQIVLSPAELADAIASLERQTALIALATRRLEASGEWAADGSVSMAAWLRSNARMSNRDAHRLLRRGRFLDTFTALADAAVTRELSAGQIDALRAAYRPKHEPVLREQQAELVSVLAPLNVADTDKACQVWARYADAVVDDGQPPAEPERSWSMSRGSDGALVGRFVFDDAVANECEKAVANALTWEGATETRDLSRRQGDAMFDIFAFYNKNHDGDGTPRHLPHITLSADAATLANGPIGVNDDTGRVIDTGCVGTYLCDCKIHAILRDAGRPTRNLRAQPIHRAPQTVPPSRRPRPRLPDARLRPPRPPLRRSSHLVVGTTRPHRPLQPHSAVLPPPPHGPPPTPPPETATQRRPLRHLARRNRTRQPPPRPPTQTLAHLTRRNNPTSYERAHRRANSACT